MKNILLYLSQRVKKNYRTSEFVERMQVHDAMYTYMWETLLYITELLMMHFLCFMI
jgi:hypothetical protein